MDSDQKPVASNSRKSPVSAPPTPDESDATAAARLQLKMPNKLGKDVDENAKNNGSGSPVAALDIPSDDEIVAKLMHQPDATNEIASGIVERSTSGDDIGNQSVKAVAARFDNNKPNTSTITINSDLADQPNSLASNVSQITVVTSHPPVLVDNSLPLSPPAQLASQISATAANEVIIVSNEMNKSMHVNESSTDEDFPSLDSLECSSSRHNKHAAGAAAAQSTIIIADDETPSKTKKPRARKLDESEVFIVNNEEDSVLSEFDVSGKTNKLLDTSHVSVVTVGEEIHVKDSSNSKVPLSHSSSCEISATIEAMNETSAAPLDGANDETNKNLLVATRNKMNGQLRHTPSREDDVSIIVNKRKTRPKISPDSSVGSMDSRTHSECGSMRSSVGVPSPAITGKIDRSDAESIATTNSHDSSNHGEEEPAVIIRRTKPSNDRITKEEIELRNLKKKTRKRTRKFTIDGVQVTTTTSKVIYGDDENGKMYDDHIFRKQELRELKMLQKQEKKQFLDLQIKEQASKEQQERRFDQERIALERTYESDMDALARQHRQLVEKTEQQQEADLRATSKKIRAEQERDLKLVCKSFTACHIDIHPFIARMVIFLIHNLFTVPRQFEAGIATAQTRNRSSAERET